MMCHKSLLILLAKGARLLRNKAEREGERENESRGAVSS